MMIMNILRNYFNLHRMIDCDDVNFYYKKFLIKLSQTALKIFLPLLSLVYLCVLCLCRFVFAKHRFDYRTICFLTLTIISFVLICLIRLHRKWRRFWICIRLVLVVLLLLPSIFTYQTEQFHILFSSISILLVYAFLTFTFLQSLIISLSISIIHIYLSRKSSHLSELFALIIYHFIVNLTGLDFYIRSIENIRQHFSAYKLNLIEKNQSNIDCKKLTTILRYCPQMNSTASSNLIRTKFGTIINCSISLNHQTCLRTNDEFASLVDVLFCQIEQFIQQQRPNAFLIFDNETILILIPNENQTEQFHIETSCQLALEFVRFIQHVNDLTHWNLHLTIGIDYDQIEIYSNQFLQSSIYNYTRWLREQCSNQNFLALSPKIYEIVKTNSSYELSSTNNSVYFLCHSQNHDRSSQTIMPMNTSDMIDQLTRIQAEYFVEKHLGTMTLSRSIRKHCLIELTSDCLHWFSLNFKDKSLTKDFQTQYRIDHPKIFLYIFIFFILFGSVIQSLNLNHLNIYYLIIFPLIIIGLIILIYIFYSSIDTNKRFSIHLNILICLTISTLIYVGIQYQSIQNFQYVFPRHTTNQTDDQSSIFNRNYHQYLIVGPLYPLYFCTLFRQCSWLIKTCFLLICSTLQLYIFEYVWLMTNVYMTSITDLHHYTTFTLIILHNLLLILLTYVQEWLEKIDFLWLKQMDNERLVINRQKNHLIHQLNFLFPKRTIEYYLNTKSLTQHYHFKYEHIAFLYVQFHENESQLSDFIQNIDYLLRTNEQYSNIVMHKKSTMKQLIFTLDLSNSLKFVQILVEFLFDINERLKCHQINLSACLHIGTLNEILIHFSKHPKIDIWSEHLSFLEYLLSKIPINHCLITSSVYNLLNDVYLYRTAGSIQKTSMNIESNTTIYFLLGRLIGENIFQGRNTLPISFNHECQSSIRKSSSTDESQLSQQQKLLSSTTTTTTTASFGTNNDRQSLIKQSSQVEQQRQQSLSTTNEETMSSFSGWDHPSVDKSEMKVSETVIDGYYPSRPCDLSFTVNMTTTEDKSTIVQRTPSPKFRPKRFNLARKLIADTSESEMSVHQQPWTRNSVYQSRNLQRTRLSSSYTNLSKSQSKESPITICHTDLLQRWLEDQLSQFRSQIKQTPPPLLPRKPNRFSAIEMDSSDESDTLQENTFPISNSKPVKRPYHHIRYKPLRKTLHLIRHESLKARNRPLLLEKYSTSMPRSDLSDLDSSRPDNLSEDVLSNFESEYDNMGTNGSRLNKSRRKNHSQIITDGDDDEDNDESDDETTFRTTVNRCYF